MIQNKFLLLLLLVSTSPLAAQEIPPPARTNADTTKSDTLKNYLAPEITVTATRARERETPAAFSNLDRETLRKNFYGQDAAQVLSELPSTYFYSDNGNNFGYSYLRIRGFSQDRIAVTLNAMPLNDAESHSVFWINQPDLLSSIADIQVQRGVSQSTYGAAAIGGAVNMVSSTFADRRNASLSFSGGSFNTQRLNVSLASGLIGTLESRYAVAARFSRIRSDGYRQNAFTDMYSYFLTATRFDSGMTTKLVVLGGPERTGLAYFGVPQQALETDRTQNDFGKFDTDNFNQPVYQLIHEWTVSPNIMLSNTFYHIKGDGFYTQQLFGDALLTYRLGNFKVSDSLLYPTDFYEQDASGALIKDADGFYSITRSDVITKRSLDLSDYGWIPQLTWQHTRGRLLIGGELRVHTGRHFGELQSGNALPASAAPNQLYYDYDTYRTSGVFYLSENFQLTPEINLNADLRLQAMRYGVAADRFDQLKYSLNYFFVNPRVGINFNAAENLSIYASLGSVQREPTLSSFQFEGQLPLFKKVDPAQGIYEEPLLKPEQMLDAELGAAWRGKNWSLKAGVYGMDFQNELVFGGQLNDVGLPIYGNAERTRHLGFELDLALQTGIGLDFTGNLNVSQNTFVRYTEYGYDAAGNITAAVLDGKTIALNPSVIANVRAKYAYKNFYVSAAMQAVGRQYFDNTETPERSSDPYAVMNLNVSYRLENVFFSQAEVSAVVNNVWDARYETSGVIDYFGSPRWFVGAPRNVFLTLRLSL